MLAGKVSPNESPFGVDTISNFMEKVVGEIDQKVKKRKGRRPKRCPYDYTRVLNVSKSLGWIGADRMYMGYIWTGLIKMVLGLICLMFAPITFGNSIIMLGVIWLGDLVLIYSGSLPPANCYKDNKFTKPGWRYYSKTGPVEDKVSYISDNGGSGMFIAIFVLIALIGLWLSNRFMVAESAE